MTVEGGTPVVAAYRGAPHKLLASGAGLAVTPRADAFADAVRELLRRPANVAGARVRAERYPWSPAIAGMLDVLTARPCGHSPPAPCPERGVVGA